MNSLKHVIVTCESVLLLLFSFLKGRLTLTVITCYVSRGGRNIHNLCYGGGTTLIAENAKDLHTLVLKSKSTMEKKGLTLNIKKTTLMTTGTTTGIRTDIKVVESFCLSDIKSKGTINQENAP